MSAEFYKQESGLLRPPAGYKKWHISWTLSNVLEGFKYFYSMNNRYPNHIDLQHCEYLPNVKTLQRKFGGIIAIRKSLGDLEPDHSSGIHRSTIAKIATSRAFTQEIEIYKELISRFGESFVHFQSRVVYSDNTFVDVDYLVFHSLGKFAIDIFHPDSEWTRFSNNVSIKRRTYQFFPFELLLCVMNPQVTDVMLNRVSKSQKQYQNIHTKLIHYRNLETEVGKYLPR